MSAATKLTAKKRALFLDTLSRTGNVSHSALAAGTTRYTVYGFKGKDPLFSAAWDDAVEQAVDLLLIEARRRAFHGVMKPVFYQGAMCGSVQEYSDSLMMFLIKAKRPEYATERREVSGPGGGPIETRTEMAPDERAELKEVAAELARRKLADTAKS